VHYVHHTSLLYNYVHVYLPKQQTTEIQKTKTVKYAYKISRPHTEFQKIDADPLRLSSPQWHRKFAETHMYYQTTRADSIDVRSSSRAWRLWPVEMHAIFGTVLVANSAFHPFGVDK